MSAVFSSAVALERWYHAVVEKVAQRARLDGEVDVFGNIAGRPPLGTARLRAQTERNRGHQDCSRDKPGFSSSWLSTH